MKIKSIISTTLLSSFCLFAENVEQEKKSGKLTESHIHQNLPHLHQKEDYQDLFTYEGHLRTFFINDTWKNNDVYAHGDVALSFNPGKYFSLEAIFKAEKSGDQDSTKRFQFFNDQSIFLDELILSFNPTDKLSIFGGKIAPGFGLSEDVVPGWYGFKDFDYYSIGEQLGLGLSYQFADSEDYGQHSFSLVTFTRDNTNTTNDFFRSSSRSIRDGDVGNTGKLDSFGLQFQGEQIRLKSTNYEHEFSYAVGLVHRSAGKYQGHGNQENRFLIGGTYTLHLSSDVALKSVYQVCKIFNADGENCNRIYQTFGGGIVYKNWEFGGSFTTASNDELKNMSQISLAYKINENFKIHLGFAHEETEEMDQQYVGTMLEINF